MIFFFTKNPNFLSDRGWGEGGTVNEFFYKESKSFCVCVGGVLE